VVVFLQLPVNSTVDLALYVLAIYSLDTPKQLICLLTKFLFQKGAAPAALSIDVYGFVY
jgi:hypothetical protein